MIDCHACESYHSGKGEKKCLKCRKYLYFTIESNKRNPIVFEHIPESILNNVADPDTDERMPSIIDAIRHLSPELSMIVSAHYISGLSLAEIGIQVGKSEATISRKLSQAVQALKNIIANDNN